METIQEIIDTIKQWPATIWWVMGALFIIPRFWDTPPRKKRNKDKMTDDKNNDLKSSNMTDKKEFGGNLMEEGVIMWAIFTKEGKAALRMDYEVHPENGKVGYGRLLSPDVSVLHEILTPDDADRFLSLPEYGISIRIRMRLRYQGTEDRVVKQSEYEPEMCFTVWIVPRITGSAGFAAGGCTRKGRNADTTSKSSWGVSPNIRVSGKENKQKKRPDERRCACVDYVHRRGENRPVCE